MFLAITLFEKGTLPFSKIMNKDRKNKSPPQEHILLNSEVLVDNQEVSLVYIVFPRNSFF
jgi:hypothetical protein